MSVLVIGDTNVDLEIRLPTDAHRETHANPDPELFGGGSAANTAAALARLGVACRFAGAAGDDGFGRFAVDSLSEAGVDTSPVTVAPGEPTVVVVAVVQPDGDRLIYVWPPSGGAHRALRQSDAVDAVTGSTWLHVSGICLRVQPARDALLAAMRRARTEGIPVSFDLNLRLENWGWEAGFREVVEAAVELADVVLGAASDEIGALAGLDDPVMAAKSLAGDDRLVIARLGPAGAVACSANTVTTVAGFEVSVADTVGAGDAFDAGFIAARIDGENVAEAIRWGNAVAGLTVSKPGARSSPTRREVEGLLAE
ncbi:MAG: sugar kinase [Acidimicrobiia bacterium]